MQSAPHIILDFLFDSGSLFSCCTADFFLIFIFGVLGLFEIKHCVSDLQKIKSEDVVKFTTKYITVTGVILMSSPST